MKVFVAYRSSLRRSEGMARKGLDKQDVVYLSPKERAERETRLKNSREYLKNYRNSEYSQERNRDTTSIREQMKQDEQVLSKLSAPTVSEDSEKNAMLRRAKKLEEDIKTGMPTRDEMMGKRLTNDYGGKYQEAIPKIVDKQIKWQLEKSEAVREWKRIQRTLNPDDPNAANVENLRRTH
jgi:hypothetical protein